MEGNLNVSVKIAVIFPSRGLVFSQTAQELLDNLKGWHHKIYFSHGKPIPDCFEVPTQEALKDPEITHLWFVEDDMVLPPSILSDMLYKDMAVVTVNYPTTSKGDSSILSVKGRIVYAGTGCTLVKRAVFDELSAPYFRTDLVWIPKNYGDHLRFTCQKRTDKSGYGLHDVNFFMHLYERGIPVHKLDYSIGQRKLVELGKAGTNNGAHNIEVWKKVKKDRYPSLIKNLPVQPKSKLAVIDVDGKHITTNKDHADKLLKLGTAQKIPHKPVVLDWSNA
jgi:hypothetical protein